jgi:hypothetical protein
VTFNWLRGVAYLRPENGEIAANTNVCKAWLGRIVILPLNFDALARLVVSSRVIKDGVELCDMHHNQQRILLVGILESPSFPLQYLFSRRSPVYRLS